MVERRTLGNCTGLVTEACILVSDHMLISILSVLVEPFEMSCAEAVDALAPRAGDTKAEDLTDLTARVCHSESFGFQTKSFTL